MTTIQFPVTKGGGGTVACPICGKPVSFDRDWRSTVFCTHLQGVRLLTTENAIAEFEVTK